MDIGTQLDYFRKEHLDLLRVLDEWRCALDQLSGEGERRRKGLEALRRMERDLVALRNHCRLEERSLEFRYPDLLQKAELDRLQSEHEDLERLLQDTMQELRFATLDRTTELTERATELATLGRQHILYEEKLLSEIERGLLGEAKQKFALR